MWVLRRFGTNANVSCLLNHNFVLMNYQRTFFILSRRKLNLRYENKSSLLQYESQRFNSVEYKYPTSSSHFRKLCYIFIVSSAIGIAITWPKFHKWANVNATTEISERPDDEVSNDEQKSVKKKKHTEKVSFRDKKIIQYENRLRSFATPEKIFRYFATVRVGRLEEWDIYMTPDDLIRSITPNAKQPDGLGLDQYKKCDAKNVNMKHELALDEDSIFYKLRSSGLISFSDYIFLLTVMATSQRHFEIAFKMFDLNGDGEVDLEEFEKVTTLMRRQSSICSRHRDHVTNTGNTSKGVNSALTKYFFGPRMDQKLTIKKFIEFQQQLQREIFNLAFQRKNPDETGNISEADFTELLLTYAEYKPKKKSRIIKRVKTVFNENAQGINRDDYFKFFYFLNNINDIDIALTYYRIVGASIDQATLKHVAKTVAQVDLTDHIINVVFTIFDENLDGRLSHKEFVAIMKTCLLRGLEKPKDTGFLKIIQSTIKCAKETNLSF